MASVTNGATGYGYPYPNTLTLYISTTPYDNNRHRIDWYVVATGGANGNWQQIFNGLAGWKVSGSGSWNFMWGPAANQQGWANNWQASGAFDYWHTDSVNLDFIIGGGYYSSANYSESATTINLPALYGAPAAPSADNLTSDGTPNKAYSKVTSNGWGTNSSRRNFEIISGGAIKASDYNNSPAPMYWTLPNVSSNPNACAINTWYGRAVNNHVLWTDSGARYVATPSAPNLTITPGSGTSPSTTISATVTYKGGTQNSSTCDNGTMKRWQFGKQLSSESGAPTVFQSDVTSSDTTKSYAWNKDNFTTGNNYKFYVRSVNTLGGSSVTTSNVIYAPTGVTGSLQSRTTESLTLRGAYNYAGTINSSTSGTISCYEIKWSTDKETVDNGGGTATGAQTDNTFTITGLTNDQTVYYRVYAWNVYGLSNTSGTLSATTLPRYTPSLSNISTTPLSPGGDVAFTINRTGGLSANELTVTSVEISRRPLNSSTFTSLKTIEGLSLHSGDTYTIRNAWTDVATTGGDYVYKIHLSNGTDESDTTFGLTAPSSVTTTAGLAGDEPIQITATGNAVSPTQLYKWDLISVSTGQSKTLNTTSTNPTITTSNHLNYDTTYIVKMRAYNTYGLWRDSEEVTVKTKPRFQFYSVSKSGVKTADALFNHRNRVREVTDVYYIVKNSLGDMHVGDDLYNKRLTFITQSLRYRPENIASMALSDGRRIAYAYDQTNDLYKFGIWNGNNLEVVFHDGWNWQLTEYVFEESTIITAISSNSGNLNASAAFSTTKCEDVPLWEREEIDGLGRIFYYTDNTYTATDQVDISTQAQLDSMVSHIEEGVTVSGEGTDITLEGTTVAPLADMQLKGDTYQQTYSGKNLFLLSVITSSTNSGVTFTNNGDSISIQGTASANIDKFGYVNLDTVPASLIENGATYTISTNKPLPSGVILSVMGYKETNNWITDLVVLNGDGTRLSSSKTVSMPATTARIRYNLKINSGTTVDISNLTIQYEKGSSVTSFEPYVGGIPAPNPDYPQDVQVVTGEQTVEVTGKNLINTVETNKAVSSTGAIINPSTNYLGIDSYVACKPNTTYTITFEHNIPNANLYIGYKDANGDFISRISYQTTRTFTTPDNAHSMFVYLNKNGVTFETIGGYVQLEQGSTATGYEPYRSQSYIINLGSIELCKIGDYQDYIYKSGDDWYVHKAIKKKLLDGTGTNIVNSYHNQHNGINGFRIVLSSDEYCLAPNKIYSDKFIYALWSSYNTESGRTYGMVSETSGANNYIYITQPNSSTGATTGSAGAAEMNTWLTNNNVLLYYALETPTDTKITNDALVEQLDALYAAKSYDDITIISVNGDLPAQLSVEAYTAMGVLGDWSTTINGKTITNNNIKSLVLTNQTTNIPDFFVANSPRLQSVVMANANTESIGDYTCCGCAGLLTASLPRSLTSIPSYVFYNDMSLNTLMNIPDNVKTIGHYFMAFCYRQNQAVNLPEGLTTIGNYFMSGCGTFDQPMNLPSTLGSIGSYFMSANLLFDRDLILPSNLHSLKEGFLYNCLNMTRTIDVGDLSPSIATSSANTLSTIIDTAAIYVTGITIKGSTQSAWLAKFANSDVSPYRYLKEYEEPVFVDRTWHYDDIELDNYTILTNMGDFDWLPHSDIWTIQESSLALLGSTSYFDMYDSFSSWETAEDIINSTAFTKANGDSYVVASDGGMWRNNLDLQALKIAKDPTIALQWTKRGSMSVEEGINTYWQGSYNAPTATYLPIVQFDQKPWNPTGTIGASTATITLTSDELKNIDDIENYYIATLTYWNGEHTIYFSELSADNYDSSAGTITFYTGVCGGPLMLFHREEE